MKSTGIVSDEKFYERENAYLKKLMDACKNLSIKYSDNLSVKSKNFATQIMHADDGRVAQKDCESFKKINGRPIS